MRNCVFQSISSTREARLTQRTPSFFLKLSPWCMYFNVDLDQGASTMRIRSPLLFHAILLSTGYYLSASRHGSQTYRGLTALVNELIAPLVVSALPQQLNVCRRRKLLPKS
mgnify:CR=1 FL=1